MEGNKQVESVLIEDIDAKTELLKKCLEVLNAIPNKKMYGYTTYQLAAQIQDNITPIATQN